MTKFLAKCLAADETGLLYLVDRAGRITPIRRTTYEALPDSDPRLDEHLYLVRSDAVRASLKRRGLPTGPEVWTN